MVALAFAAFLAVTAAQDPSQDRPPVVPRQQEAVDLGEVTVTGRTLDTLISDFVNEVAAPNRHRGIARWRNSICVGVANLRQETAQYLVDRVSTVAEDLGLEPGDPGCTPNVLIIASAQPDELARDMVGEYRRIFRAGGSGMDRGRVALEAFVESDAPVRWWQVSVPTDSQTGDRAVRISGECRAACDSAMDYAPIINVNSASRLRSQIVDYLARTIVVLDVDKVDQVSAQQLADYVAMVTLAQINAQADTSAYASILNVFEDPGVASSLTEWDQAYLQGLYDAERNRKNLRAGQSEISRSIRRAHEAAEPEQ